MSEQHAAGRWVPEEPTDEILWSFADYLDADHATSMMMAKQVYANILGAARAPAEPVGLVQVGWHMRRIHSGSRYPDWQSVDLTDDDLQFYRSHPDRYELREIYARPLPPPPEDGA